MRAREREETHEGSVVDGPCAGLEAAHEELAHRAVLAQVLLLALVEVDAKDPGVELVARDAEPDGELDRVDEAVQARDGP